MRILHILTGLAVLFTTLAFGHIVHHLFFGDHWSAQSFAFWTGLGTAVVIGAFSLIGACLLFSQAG